MSCPLFKQDVLDKRPKTIDFGSKWLASGAQISTVAWTVPAGITQSDSSNDGTTATNYFSGGTKDEEYEIACKITTDETPAQEKTQRFRILIESGCD